MDEAWWKVHIAEVRAVFGGEWLCYGNDAEIHGARSIRKVRTGWKAFGNSGAGAIGIAALSGASKILMLGYDCKHKGNQTHWHGDHPRGTAGNASPKIVARWPGQFRELRDSLRGVEIINCSRETALTVFRMASLKEALA